MSKCTKDNPCGNCAAGYGGGCLAERRCFCGKLDRHHDDVKAGHVFSVDGGSWKDEEIKRLRGQIAAAIAIYTEDARHTPEPCRACQLGNRDDLMAQALGYDTGVNP